ncbi:MAG: PKD domain-containing protein [Crocinitomicaceae bacterium]|nr:PKD domain-containing protein [Crocinitomicaceae bacterium]
MKRTFTLLIALAFFGMNANAQCAAGYTNAPGANAGEIDFTNISTGPLLSYSYIEYGDGSSEVIGAGATLTHAYAMNGTYNACVTIAASDSSCVDTYCGTITIAGLTGCTAGFTSYQAIDSTGAGGTIVWVTNTSTTQSGTALTYSWDFGDGTTSTDAYPTHVYSTIGTYTVCVTIADGTGCTDTYCDDITVTQKAVGFTLNVIVPGTMAVEEQKLLTGLNLYPNPTQGDLTLSLNSANDSEVQISIMNLAGQIMNVQDLMLNSGQNNVTVESMNLTDGFYFVRVVSSNNNQAELIQFVKN